MMYRTEADRILAVSQPAHAWISGQMMRAWREPLPEPLLFAAEMHDIGWLDWEVEPSFDVATGRPHLFRDVGAATHEPMWRHGIARALAAWGPHVALLISRHGGIIYRRYNDRHNANEADASAVRRFLEHQPREEARWAQALGLDDRALDGQSALIAFSDTLSLALCGFLPAPLTLEVPLNGDTAKLRLEAAGSEPFSFTLDPWPFRNDSLTVRGEGRPLPATGRFADEREMRRWAKSAAQAKFEARLSRV